MKCKGTGIWIALGAGVGAAIGAATHDMAVALGIGVAVGAAIDLTIASRRRAGKRGAPEAEE